MVPRAELGYPGPMRGWVGLALFLCTCGPEGGVDAGGEADAAAALDGATPDAGAPSSDAASAAECVAFEPAVDVGAVADAALDELSGIAASRVHAGALYVHNDSGGGPRIYVLDEADVSLRGTIELSGAGGRDYEDIAVGPGADGAPWVFVGDTGDNAARDGSGAPRSSVFVYRFPESAVDAAGAFGTATVTPEAVELTYPDGPRDCESVAIGETGDLYLLSKHDAGVSTLYVARAPFGDAVTLEIVTTIDVGGATVPGARQTTGMDLSRSGRALLLRTYNRAYLFTRGADETWADGLGRAPTRLPAAFELQGEAIAWRADGRAYFTISEMAGQVLHRYDASVAGCSPL